MKKIFASIAIFLAAVMSANATMVVKSEDFKSFTGIYAQDEVVVKLHHGTEYSVKLEVDERVADFCKMYLHNGALTVDVDKANFPKELKAQLRQKGGDVSYTLSVTVPDGAAISSITLKENSKLYADGNITLASKCQIELSDNAYAKFVRLNCAECVVKTSKKAVVNGYFNVQSFNCNASNSSVIDCSTECKRAELEFEGSSKSVVDLRSDETWITYSGFSKTLLKGHTLNLNINGKGASELDAYALNSDNASVNLVNCTCKIHPAKALELNLSNGAKLEYDGDPVITIRKINVSSVLRAQDVKKN